MADGKNIEGERFKSSDLVEIAIANLRETVGKCNIGAILHAASVSKHLEYGFYVDKSINSDKFSELDLKLADLMGKFRNNCSCIKSIEMEKMIKSMREV